MMSLRPLHSISLPLYQIFFMWNPHLCINNTSVKPSVFIEIDINVFWWNCWRQHGLLLLGAWMMLWALMKCIRADFPLVFVSLFVLRWSFLKRCLVDVKSPWRKQKTKSPGTNEMLESICAHHISMTDYYCNCFCQPCWSRGQCKPFCWKYGNGSKYDFNLFTLFLTLLSQT